MNEIEGNTISVSYDGTNEKYIWHYMKHKSPSPGMRLRILAYDEASEHKIYNALAYYVHHPVSDEFEWGFVTGWDNREWVPRNKCIAWCEEFESKVLRD